MSLSLHPHMKYELLRRPVQQFTLQSSPCHSITAYAFIHASLSYISMARGVMCCLSNTSS